MDHERASLEQRLTALERANRRLRAGLGVVLLAGIAVVLGAQDRPRPPRVQRISVLEVERLVLLDAQGKERARLALDEAKGTAGLHVHAPKSGRSAFFGVRHQTTPGFSLANDRGKQQLIASLQDGGPALLLSDSAGDWGTSLTLSNEDRTSLLGMQVPGDEEMRLALTFEKSGEAYLKLRGAEGTLRMGASPRIGFSPAGK